MSDRPETVTRPAVAHGWMLRSNGDITDVWERPDGMLIAVKAGHTPSVITLLNAGRLWRDDVDRIEVTPDAAS